MLGVSLPYRFLAEHTKSPYDSYLAPNARKAFFAALKDAGAESVEIRTVAADREPAKLAAMARELWLRGFPVTVHAKPKTAESAVCDVFGPLSLLLAELPAHQSLLNITVHPVGGEDVLQANIRMLNALADHILENELPARISLENNRLMPDKTVGDSVSLVASAVGAVRERLQNDPRVGSTERSDRNCVVGICFDMGHYLWWWNTVHPGEPYRVPPKAFLQYVIHTHIHGVSPAGETHFPLPSGEMSALASLPLTENLRALERSFAGTFNLELSPERFAAFCAPLPALQSSLAALKAAVPPTLRLYEDLRRNFPARFASACSILKENPAAATLPQNPDDSESSKSVGHRFGLVQSTFYVFSTNGTKWVMDPALRAAGDVTNARETLAERLHGAEYIFITHRHEDHLDPSAVAALAGKGFRWIVPDWLTEKMQAFGLSADEILPVRVGDVLHLGTLTVEAYEGHHFRPQNHKGVRCMAYKVKSPGCRTLLFPGDVRDFAPAQFADMGRTDVLFAHVWLGDHNCLDADFPLIRHFVRLMLSFRPKTVVLTHLYEATRKEDSMWTRAHAERIADAMRAQAPDTEILIPQSGDIMNL